VSFSPVPAKPHIILSLPQVPTAFLLKMVELMYVCYLLATVLNFYFAAVSISQTEETLVCLQA